MNYSINTFFDKKKCNEIIEFCEQNGVQFWYDPKSVWDCKRIYDQEFKDEILKTINDLYLNKSISFWFDYSQFDIRNTNVSLTKYYNGRYLDLHRDVTSNYTTVISLNEDYEDGDFCLSDRQIDVKNSEIKIHLNMGEGVTFEGCKIYHGVLPVTTGTRYALNIWINNSDFNYEPNQIRKKLI